METLEDWGATPETWKEVLCTLWSKVIPPAGHDPRRRCCAGLTNAQQQIAWQWPGGTDLGWGETESSTLVCLAQPGARRGQHPLLAAVQTSPNNKPSSGLAGPAQARSPGPVLDTGAPRHGAGVTPASPQRATASPAPAASHCGAAAPCRRGEAGKEKGGDCAKSHALAVSFSSGADGHESHLTPAAPRAAPQPRPAPG